MNKSRRMWNLTPQWQSCLIKSSHSHPVYQVDEIQIPTVGSLYNSSSCAQLPFPIKSVQKLLTAVDICADVDLIKEYQYQVHSQRQKLLWFTNSKCQVNLFQWNKVL